MPRLTKDQTRSKLRNAVVAEAIERGFSATSVAGVVKRAKVSAGTVYVHFENKDGMLQKVFLEIKTEFHATMVGAKAEANSADMIRRMWFDMFAFVGKQPSDFLYLEYGNSARILTPAQEEQTLKMTAEISEMLQQGINDGTLADIGVETLSLLLVAPAMQLARRAVLSNQPISTATTELVFERIWRAIAA